MSNDGNVQMNQGPLSDVRVLEFDDGFGSFAGKLLADLGADVVKVEPRSGSRQRSVGPFAGDVADRDRSLTFWHYNTNKRSITVDLAVADGRQVVRDLAAEYDIVLDATTDGLAAFALGYDDLAPSIPGLIFLRASAFGETGPWSGYAGSDTVLLALGGVTAMTGYDRPLGLDPVAPTGGQAAHLTGMYGAIGILGALNHRDRTGDGQYVEIAAHDVVAVSTELSVPYWEFRKERVYRQTARHARPADDTPHQVTKCRDGKYIIALSLYLFDEMRFPAMITWMDDAGMAEDLTDAAYDDPNVRHERMDHIIEVVHRFCAAHDSDYLFVEAQKRRLPWSPLNEPAELVHDRHVLAREAIAWARHEGIDEPVAYAGAPYKFSETPWSLRTTAPALSEHTRELLARLGRSETDIERLVESGAI